MPQRTSVLHSNLVCFIQFSGPDIRLTPKSVKYGKAVFAPENKVVGAVDGEGTPVPIPNTAVKLTRADNTWLEAARDDW